MKFKHFTITADGDEYAVVATARNIGRAVIDQNFDQVRIDGRDINTDGMVEIEGSAGSGYLDCRVTSTKEHEADGGERGLDVLDIEAIDNTPAPEATIALERV